MESLRLKFGFLSPLKMDKVMAVRTALFDTLQRTACDYTNCFRALSGVSVLGMGQWDRMKQQNDAVDGDGVSVAECMKREDAEFVDFAVSQCASIAIYSKMGYESRMQHSIKQIEWFIENEVEIQGVSSEEMKELAVSLKRRSVLIYDGDEEEDEFMRLEIHEMESEQRKQERDRILWTRFVAEYRKAVNAEYEGDIVVDEGWDQLDANTLQNLRALNAERVKTMNGVNPKYVLRNYLMQQAIALSKKEDHSMVHDLLKMVESPFVDQPQCDKDDYTCPVPLEACGFCVSCAS